MKSIVIILFLALVSFFAWYSPRCCDHEYRLVRGLTEDAEAVLQKDLAHSGITVTGDYLDVVLSGKVAPMSRVDVSGLVQEKMRAGRVIDLIETVDSSSSEVTVVPGRLFFDRRGDELILSGSLNSESLKSQLETVALRVPFVKSVVNDITVSPNVTSVRDWNHAVALSQTFMENAKEGYLEWSTDQIVLRGKVHSESVSLGLEDQARTLLESGSVVNGLEIGLPPAEESDDAVRECLVMETSAGTYAGVLRGTVSTAGLRAEALAVAREVAPEIDWSNELAVAPGPENPTAGQFPTLIRTYLQERGAHAGGFSLGAKEVKLLDTEDLSARVRLSRAFRNQLGPEITQMVDVGSISRGLSLRQRRDADWIAIQGVFPNETIQQEVLAVTKATHANAESYDFTKVGAGIDSPVWQDHLQQFLHGYTATHGLSDFDLEENHLRLLGSVPDEVSKVAVEEWAQSLFENSMTIENQLSVRSVAPVTTTESDRPTPQSPPDQESVREKLKSYPIYFGTNQEEASDSELAKLGAVMELISSLPGEVALAAVGFADSRGNAAYNKALSLRRARHVKDAMVRLGISSDRITLSSFGSVATADDAATDEELRRARRVEVQLSTTLID